MTRLLTTLFVVSLTACPGPQQPVTTCTGPDPGDDGVPVERLPFDKSGLGADCNVDGGDGDTSRVTAQVARDENELLDALGCTQGTINVDFGNEEVLILDVPDTVTVDAVFDLNGALVVATSSTATCRGVPPTVVRQITALQRTGDDGVGIRACVTSDPNPAEFECP